jgi:hypothetical protein
MKMSHPGSFRPEAKDVVEFYFYRHCQRPMRYTMCYRSTSGWSPVLVLILRFVLQSWQQPNRVDAIASNK